MIRTFAAALLVAALSVSPSSGDACRSVDAEAPRVLVMALDGVPLRSIEAARAKGAFADWLEPEPMISSFPSVTNVAFSAMFHPFGVDPSQGYEVSHFSLAKNKVVGSSPFGYEDRLYAWRDAFDVTSRSFGSKFKSYTMPRRTARHSIEKAEEALYQSPEKRLVLAHVGATDALIHLRGDKAILKFLLEIDKRIAEIKQTHLARTGQPLSVVLLSDHGNSSMKIHKAKGFKKALRKAGLKVADHLEDPGTVVAPTFGIVGYGALFARREDAATAGRAVSGIRTVDQVAWLEREDRMIVRSESGEAAVRWHASPAGGWVIAYQPLTGDPLELAAVSERLRREGLADAYGFAHEDVWFEATADAEYPDAPRRLIHSLTGTWVSNYATVVFSLKPGYAWGWTSAHISSKLSGGRLEGTHGGLDAASTVGFFMADQPAYQPSHAVRADHALERFVALDKCLVVTGEDQPTDGVEPPPGPN